MSSIPHQILHLPGWGNIVIWCLIAVDRKNLARILLLTCRDQVSGHSEARLPSLLLGLNSYALCAVLWS